MGKGKKRCLAILLAVSTAFTGLSGALTAGGAENFLRAPGLEKEASALPDADAETGSAAENPETETILQAEPGAAAGGSETGGTENGVSAPGGNPDAGPEADANADTNANANENTGTGTDADEDTDADTDTDTGTAGSLTDGAAQEDPEGTGSSEGRLQETAEDPGSEESPEPEAENPDGISAEQTDVPEETESEAAGGEETESATEAESETESEMDTESGLHTVYLMQDERYALEVSQNRYEYAEGETVLFTTEPSDGETVVSAKVLEVMEAEEAGPEYTQDAELVSDFLDRSENGEEPDLLLVAGEAAEAVRESEDAAPEPGEEAHPEQSQSVHYSFVMPDSDVMIVCATEAAASPAASSPDDDGEESAPQVDHAELIVDTVPGPAQYPQNLVSGSSRLWTSVKHVKLYDRNGNLIDTCLAYCMQPSLGGPDSGTTVPESRIDELETGTKDRTLAKILYYLYGGPAWDRDVTDRDGNVLNYRALMEAIGCSADGNCLAVTHLVLGYVYDSSRWNYGCNAMGNPVANALNSEGQNAIRELADKIRNMPDPRAEFSSVTTDSYYADGQVRSETITYHANADNAAVVKLPAGISLCNETTGEVCSGTVSISGGDRFHLIADGVSGNGTYVFTTTFATDFSAYKISFPGKQDLGFSYTAGDRKISLSVSWKTPLVPVSVKKVSEKPGITEGNSMYSLAGAVFKLYRGDAEIASFTTDEEGNTAAVEVEPGTYLLKETTTPRGFKKAKDQTVTIAAGDGTKILTVADEPVTGTCGVLLRKKIAGDMESDIPKSGAQFRVEFYGAKTASGTPLKTWIFETDSDGIVQFSSGYRTGGDALYGEGVLPLGTVKVTETRAPEGFLLDSDPQTMRITQSGETAVFENAPEGALFLFEDTLIFGGVRLKKEDKEQGTAQGDATLAGAEFSICNANDYNVIRADDPGRTYRTGEEVCRIRTDKTGMAQTPEEAFLQAGTYTVKEVKAPEGYLLEDYSRTFTITDNGQTVDLSGTPARDRVIRFDLTIQKFRDTSDREEPGENLIPLEGIVFGIYLESSGEKVLSITTDELGTATTKDPAYPSGKLPYGRYVVKEEVYPADVIPVSDFIVEGTEDGKEYKGIYKNDVPVEEYLELKKVDAETGKPIASGAVFQILDEQKQTVSFRVNHPKHQIVTEFVTDENGTVSLPERLPYGTYYLHEVKAPEGYLLGKDLRFTVSGRNSWENTLTVTFQDTPVKGKIRLEKRDGDTGEALGGAVFQVFAAEDILTGDGTCHLSKDELADTIEVGADGTGSSKALYPGNYYLKEVKAPEGYCLDSKRYEAALDCLDQQTAVVYADVTAANHPTKLTLMKKDTDGETLAGIVFEIKKIKSAAVSSDPETSASEAAGAEAYTTDSQGRIQISYLTSGTYSVSEKETLPGYLLDPEPRYVTVDKDGFIFETDSGGRALFPETEKTNACQLLWVNDYTKWDFSKTDVNGDGELPGAEMAILDQDGQEVCSWISGEEPHRVNKLPIGTYTLTERSAPDGYVTALEMPFTVTETGIVQRQTMFDKQLLVKKVNPDGTDVPGAALEIRDLEGNVLDAWETDGNAHAASGLAVGNTYILVETRAPEGYVEGTPVRFMVEDGRVNQVVVMVNKQVSAYKTDTSVRILAGAHLEVRQGSFDGTAVDSWISDGTAHTISGLRAGETYVLVETRAPIGYAVASPVTFTVSDDGENSSLAMVNKQVLLSKRSVTGSEELPGASIQVFDREGNLMDSWVSEEEPHPISNLVVGEAYLLHEEAAPEGYAAATDVTFLVTDDYTDQFVELRDKQVLVSKQDITEGNEIAGAVLTVLNQDGQAVDTWISEEGVQHPISGLNVGESYTLREETAPDGYVRAEEVVFTVSDDFRIQTVEMIDDVTKVEITKTDITDGKPLPGAELVIRDGSGREIERWTTGEEPHLILRLPAGEYTLTELTAPEGYEIAETVRFTVEETGEIQRVEMKDRPKTPSGDVPQTGDPAAPRTWTVLLLLSAAGILILVKKKKDSKSKSQSKSKI